MTGLSVKEHQRGFTEVAVCGQCRPHFPIFFQHRLPSCAAHGDSTSQMQRVAHEVFAWTDQHEATPEVADIVDRSLEHAIVAAGQVGILSADGHAHLRSRERIVLGMHATGFAPGREPRDLNCSPDGEATGGHAEVWERVRAGCRPTPKGTLGVRAWSGHTQGEKAPHRFQ